jgi:hypothetical protein
VSVDLGRRLRREEIVCHRDDDPANNWPANLYVGDHRSNARDRRRNGRAGLRLCEADVEAIRRALARGERGQALARRHGVHKSTVSRIRTGTRWAEC